MQLLTLSLNHTNAPLALREQVAFSAERVPDALADLHGRLSDLVPESAILSTCSRTELYCAVREAEPAQGALIDWLADGRAALRRDLCAHLHTLAKRDAVRHAFRVATGLDSMVLGEPQILGQMKRAARHAQEAGTLATGLSNEFLHGPRTLLARGTLTPHEAQRLVEQCGCPRGRSGGTSSASGSSGRRTR